jgi:UDP-glucose 4-epimerase
MGKTVAITGINSYFASTVLPKLEADPEIDKIIGIDVSPWEGGFDKVDFYKEDIRSTRLIDILKGVDVLYHLAFIVGEIRDKNKTNDININGSKNVFTACAQNKVNKVIYTSSMTVYGSHKDNPIGFKEDSPFAANDDSYYNTAKVQVENFVSEYFKDHPEITLTILRAALLVGPNMNTNNMFSKLWSMPVSALSMGCNSHNQLIHEEDLGEALYLSYKKDLPGIYNVGADDAVPTRWCFKAAGVAIVPLPSFLLKFVANVGFRLRLFPASQGWASLSEYTIYAISHKFKKACGWEPKYSSKEAFLDYLKGRGRDKDRSDDLYHAFLSWGSRKGTLMKQFLKGIHAVFMLGKIPGIRNIHPWMTPEKNSMSYLPVNESLRQEENTILPPQVVLDFIEQASIHVIMDTCGCRTAHQCKNFTNHIGCMFMGESALEMPVGASRRVTKEQALQHVQRAAKLGLIPMTGKVRVDNFLMMTPDINKLLTVCFCCHCCCMMSYFKNIPPNQLDQVLMPIEGLVVEVTDGCMGCGTCLEYCVFDAISVKDGVAMHSSRCRGCGRCERYCPNNAVSISINNPNFREDAERRIKSYVEFQ